MYQNEIFMGVANFLTELHRMFSSVCNGAIFIINDKTTTLIFHAGFYYLFDPHSRESNGVPAPNGVSVLMKFRTLSQIENYIQYVYLVSQNKVHLWFQIQIQINETAIHTIFQAHSSRHERYASILGTPQHGRRKQ